MPHKRSGSSQLPSELDWTVLKAANMAIAGIPLIMETPSQSPGPKLNYPKSLLTGKLVYREDVNEVEESTDCRDVRFLYELIK